jgi:hypothetical protein
MGCVGYRINRRSRIITPGRVYPNRHFESMVVRAEIVRPLCTSWWLRWLIDDLASSERGPQCESFISEGLVEQQISWLADAAYRLLRRHPDFQRLRRRELPRALDLDPALLRIALMARRIPPDLDAGEYSTVWRNTRAFQQVARENPRLLPLVGSYLADRRLPPGTDVVAAIKDSFREAGLSRAAWRYVTRYGSCIFKVPWQMSSNESKLDVALEYLDALDQAGLPPPPPPMLIRAWLRIYVAAEYDRIHFYCGWSDVPEHVLRTGLLEADRLRKSAELSDFVDTFLSVVHWADRADLALDRNQRRADWQWLVRRAQDWESMSKREVATQNRYWRSHIGTFKHGNLTIKPLLSSDALTREARLMRNCLAGYAERCADGLVRIFAVYDESAARPLAHIGIDFDDRTQQWELTQCKGFANRPSSRHIQELGEEIARLYNRA